MNILYCENLKPENIGSHSTHIFGVVNALRKLGHNVVLISEEKNRSETGRQSWWERAIDSLSRSQIIKPARGGFVIPYLLLRDIWNCLQVFIILVGKKERFDVIYRRSHLYNTEYLLARLFRIPEVKEVNGITGAELAIAGVLGPIARRIANKIESFSLPRADKIIVVTSNLKEVLQRDYGVPAEKIVVIPNGTNTDLFEPMDTIESREKLGLNHRSNYVCFVGAFHAWQGLETYLKSVPLVLKQCPDTRFILVGDGPMKQELVSLTERLGIANRVLFTGMVSHQDIPFYINASDVCVVPKEGLNYGFSPLKLYEYLACGRPVIATRAGGLEIIEDNGGMLVEPKNPAAFSAAIIKLLKDEALRKQMGEKGREYIVANHSWRSVAERVAEVCRTAVDSCGQRSW